MYVSVCECVYECECMNVCVCECVYVRVCVCLCVYHVCALSKKARRGIRFPEIGVGCELWCGSLTTELGILQRNKKCS